ncbi:AraC family transcriptional regulator [Alginatibacterium sediminis]|uniref:AraC family transcriptional regulator n=1 Tax=Alginatibacterium sediminis TaxID=2164068 RepID=A0A420EBI7_9ALTE|nr:helix-turn-helix transcriptional regulator [Alginatibacterium sediminis]RKF18046.1 AraC family transcriptional regulator [Alginatibacterium sediminis]
MEALHRTIQTVVNEGNEQAFSVYSSVKEQKLLNVPIAKPLLIVVLKGDKELDRAGGATCHAGEFVFFSASPAIYMRNIPQDKSYFALLIEFDFEDFDGLELNISTSRDYYIGKTTAALELCLEQFVQSGRWAPKALWSARKREIISLLCHLGHSEILSLLGSPQLKDTLHNMFVDKRFLDIGTDSICDAIAMSESTLRRKLKLEGTNLQAIKDQARLGLALHLLQSTALPIGSIASDCGYQSQSRFTQRFKHRFGLTPSELRNTK